MTPQALDAYRQAPDRLQHPAIEELYSAPPSAGVFKLTHPTAADANGVWLAPLNPLGRMKVRRISCTANRASDDSSTAYASWALALYRGTQPLNVNLVTPVGSQKNVQFVRSLGQVQHAAKDNASNASRLAVTLDKQVDLEPGAGVPYYLAFQSADVRGYLLSVPTTEIAQPTVIHVPLEVAGWQGTVPLHVGSVRLTAGTYTATGYLGTTTLTDTATMKLVRRTGGLVIAPSITVTGLLATNAQTWTIPTADIYDVFVSASSATAWVLPRDLQLEPATNPIVGSNAILPVAYKTVPAGASVGDFPRDLKIVDAAPAVPIFCLRSLLGIKRFGNPNVD